MAGNCNGLVGRDLAVLHCQQQVKKSTERLLVSQVINALRLFHSR
jgi:hypothetical protein